MTKYEQIGLTKDEKIVQGAKDRFKLAEVWESDARANYIFDLKFANGDSSNMYQWDTGVATPRVTENKPCLTINKTMQHCLNVLNDNLQNPSQVEIRPVGNGASAKAAEVFEGIIRHIEQVSHAQSAYEAGCYGQVIGGCGYWRVVTDYASEISFDQEIFIRRITDPLSVYLDPDIKHDDGSDARWGIIFREMPREEFERDYPEEADNGPGGGMGTTGASSPLGMGSTYDGDTWDTKEHVRVAEYFTKSSKTDKLHELDNGMTVRESEAKTGDLMDQLRLHSVRYREIDTPEIMWYLIAGSKIIDRHPWAGKYIPIVRVIGMETVIDKQLDRRGHTRALEDPQRIYNFWSSAAVEQVALQPKSPFLAPIEAISGFEEYWANANTESKAYLPYKSIDEHGNPIQKPERSQPPVMAQAFLDGMKIASQEMMMVSGQYEADMGAKSNDVSGKAIDARKRAGATSTYHFIEHFASAIRFTGLILVDLIPKIYDTERVIRVLGESGIESSIHLNPNAPDAHQQTANADAPDYDPAAIQAIFNPAVGTYDVVATIGPDYETRRMETFNAISKLLQSDTQLTPIIGDLLMQAADFPLADVIAKRLRNLVPPKALGINTPPPEVQQLQQQLAQQHQVMAQMSNELVQAKNKASATEEQKQIDRYEAETRRMAVVAKTDPDAIRPLIRQLVSEVLGTPINPIIAQHAYENAMMHPTTANPNPPPGQIIPGQPDPNAAPQS
jgi:hypothetical protein